MANCLEKLGYVCKAMTDTKEFMVINNHGVEKIAKEIGNNQYMISINPSYSLYIDEDKIQVIDKKTLTPNYK